MIVRKTTNLREAILLARIATLEKQLAKFGSQQWLPKQNERKAG